MVHCFLHELYYSISICHILCVCVCVYIYIYIYIYIVAALVEVLQMFREKYCSGFCFRRKFNLSTF